MASTSSHADAVADITRAAQPLHGGTGDYDALLNLIGDAPYVLMGEASHGTHEFYAERARITQRLIEDKGFTAVAVEADWPDAYRVNRYVRGEGEDTSSEQALSGFKRFPTWMWRNTDVIAFVDWLREHNGAMSPGGNKTGFYGLDLYSMSTSIVEVLCYLDEIDPPAAVRARQRYACFDHFDADHQSYGYAASFGLSTPCERAVINQLRDLQAKRADYLAGEGEQSADAYFYAQQNARLVANAKEYYRSMFEHHVSSWNLRDKHMVETLDALIEHRGSNNTAPARIVVWEHNSHIGDARATEMGRGGQWTVGQLARERYGPLTRLIGFTTYQGTVTAASDWDAEAERKRVRPALDGSCEALFHDTGLARFFLPLTGNDAVSGALKHPRLERAICVIYRPDTERQSHYFHARLLRQFDAVLHFDETSAVEPLERSGEWTSGEVPETFPSAM
jgi:erythromycin esterase-like protein